ncbi:hypothetical protein Tco_0166118 [Tanacetum coccineum]
MILLVVILPAGCLVSAGSTIILLAYFYCFCCAQFDIAGWLVSATSHLVSAGSLQSCWSYESIASAPIACTARQMVFSSSWLTAKKESGSPLQTALVCNSNPLMVAKGFEKKHGVYSHYVLVAKKCLVQEGTALGKAFLNPLKVGRLPKNGWFFDSTYYSGYEEIASPGYGCW